MAGVCLLYPEGTDTERIVSEVKAKYGEILSELPLFPMFNSLGTGMSTKKLEASDL